MIHIILMFFLYILWCFEESRVVSYVSTLQAISISVFFLLTSLYSGRSYRRCLLQVFIKSSVDCTVFVPSRGKIRGEVHLFLHLTVAPQLVLYLAIRSCLCDLSMAFSFIELSFISPAIRVSDDANSSGEVIFEVAAPLEYLIKLVLACSDSWAIAFAIFDVAFIDKRKRLAIEGFNELDFLLTTCDFPLLTKFV